MMKLAVLVTALLAIQSARGGDAPLVSIERGWTRITEVGQVLQYTVSHQGKSVAFLPVSSWKMSTNSTEPKVTFASPDYSAAITLEILPVEETLTNHFEGRILGHLTSFAADIEGEAMDYEKQVTPKTKLAGRRALFKIEGATVLVQMTCKPEVFDQMHRKFNAFVGSLHFAPTLPQDESEAP